MTWLGDVEQFIPFIKPLFDGLRSAGDLFKRDRSKEREHSIDIPKKTLILLPGIHSHALLWGEGKSSDKVGMQISGRLQATNTSKFHIRASGIKLLAPKSVDVLTHMLTAKDPETGAHSHQHLIPARSIGEVSFMFFVVPMTGVPGHPLKATISIIDQFGNEHVMQDLEFKYIGRMLGDHPR
jgi:hypothetical protein